MLGSQLIIRSLHQRGVRTIFSLSGNQIMPLYDACLDAGIRIVHVRHEAAAVFMADAWAQVTGELGVAMVTAAPGIANAIAPLYSAQQAETPLLLISGDSAVGEDGSGAFQEIDQVSITSPLTKLSLRPLTIKELYPALDSLIAKALAPRPGPVHLALPFDLLTTETGFEELPTVAMRPSSTDLDADDIAKLSTLISTAERPLVLAGPAAARPHMKTAYKELRNRLGIQIIAMESPRGLKDPSLGSLSDVIPDADLIVLAGKCLDFTLGFGRTSTLGKTGKVVVIDPDAKMLERASRLLGDRLVLALQAEPISVLSAMQIASPTEERTPWLSRLDESLRNRVNQNQARAVGNSLGPRALCETVQSFLATADDPIVICDGGEFGQWAQAFCQAPTRIINGVSGAIGAGVCYAIAAKIARPESTVVVLMGDGTAGFHLMEFDTAVREHAPIVAVIGNDLRWNAEHLIQVRTYGPERLIGCELSPTARYHDVVSALGGIGFTVNDAEALRAALDSAMNSGLPACINVSLTGEPAPIFSTTGKTTTSH